MKLVIYYIVYRLFFTIIVNALVFPFVFLFRKAIRKNNTKPFWYLLHDGNDYGDNDWRPKLKNKFLRAYFWAFRNPLHNWHYRNYIKGVEVNFKGKGTVKVGSNIKSWRTFTCTDTGTNNGKQLNFVRSLFGTQNIMFERIDESGNTQKCYRKSYCKPFKFLGWILVLKWRIGHEKGLFQDASNISFFSGINNRLGFEDWKQVEWKKLKIKK